MGVGVGGSPLMGVEGGAFLLPLRKSTTSLGVAKNLSQKTQEQIAAFFCMSKIELLVLHCGSILVYFWSIGKIDQIARY